MSSRSRYAVVHGRFQPFHNGHMEYFRWALSKCESIVIGITNFDHTAIVVEAASLHRHTKAANPFTYWERTMMVRDSLLNSGLAPYRFSIVALPIDAPERWPQYVPTDAESSVHLLRIFSAWEEEKARRLQTAGYRVEAVRPDLKRISASEVRERIASGKDWSHLVPPAVRHWIEQLDGVARIRTLQESALAPQEQG